MTRTALALVCLVGLAPAAQGLQVWDRVVLNEVFYYPMGFDVHNEYIELLNAGGTVAFLDGAVITDEGDDGMPEGVYKFPGRYGGHAIPLHPGCILLIAVDAVDDDIWPNLSHADWEFWHPADDNDNPDVPNITLVNGSNCDMALANVGDGLLIATGVDTTAAIDCWTVVDGVNWARVMDDVPISWTVCTDVEFAHACPQGNSIGRCPNGVDHNISSAADWFMNTPTPWEPNIPSYPGDCSTAVREVSWGVVKAMYR